MPATFSDGEIKRLIQERKRLPGDWRSKLRLRPKRGHRERDLEIVGDDGGEFRIILRQSEVNPLDFSVILAARVPESTRIFRLLRYNGKSHEHTNQIEGNTFYDFHIHRATERYEELGFREDAYAEPTDRYAELSGAVRCLIDDANLEAPPREQGTLFRDEFEL